MAANHRRDDAIPAKHRRDTEKPGQFVMVAGEWARTVVEPTDHKTRSRWLSWGLPGPRQSTEVSYAVVSLHDGRML